MTDKLTHVELVGSLKEHFQEQKGKLVFAEVALGSLLHNGNSLPIPDIISITPSYKKFCVEMYEVKASRGDFLGDVNSGKYQKYFSYCNKLYFACPEGIISKEEVPEGCGLVYYNSDKRSWAVKKKAEERSIEEWDSEIWMALLFARDQYYRHCRNIEDRINAIKRDEDTAFYPKKFATEVGKKLYRLEEIGEDYESLRKLLVELSGLPEGLRLWQYTNMLRELVAIGEVRKMESEK